MQRKPFILMMLLTMSAASRAATDDFDSFTGVSWVWILALSLYAVFGVILVLALCKTAAASDAFEEKTYEAILEQGRAAAGANITGGVAVAAAARSKSARRAFIATAGAERITARWSPRPYRLDLNLADFSPQFLDIHILSSDLIMVRVDDVEALEVG
jgi:hypothetical protein